MLRSNWKRESERPLSHRGPLPKPDWRRAIMDSSALGPIRRIHTHTPTKRKKNGPSSVVSDEASDDTKVQATDNSSDSPSAQAQSNGDFARALSRQLLTPKNSEDEKV